MLGCAGLICSFRAKNLISKLGLNSSILGVFFDVCLHVIAEGNAVLGWDGGTEERCSFSSLCFTREKGAEVSDLICTCILFFVLPL